jgi:hypothetical protein
LDIKDIEIERKKYADLLDEYQEKCRQFKKLQSMYDKLKRKSVIELHQQALSIDTVSGSQMPSGANLGGYRSGLMTRPSMLTNPHQSRPGTSTVPGPVRMPLGGPPSFLNRMDHQQQVAPRPGPRSTGSGNMSFSNDSAFFLRTR